MAESQKYIQISDLELITDNVTKPRITPDFFLIFRLSRFTELIRKMTLIYHPQVSFFSDPGQNYSYWFAELFLPKFDLNGFC